MRKNSNCAKRAVAGWIVIAGLCSGVAGLPAPPDLGELFPRELRQKLVSEYEKNPEAYPTQDLLGVALSYKLENELGKAEPVYKRYLKANPDDKSALYGLGTLYINTRRESEGLGLLEKAWSLGHVNSLWLLAGVNVRNGHLD